MRKYILFILIALSVLLSACSEAESKAPEYDVFHDELQDSGMRYLSIATEATKEEDLKQIVQSIYNSDEYNKDTDSVFLYITKPGDENTDNDDIINPAIMTAKYANNDRGLAQTGLDNADDFYYEMKE